ncbi:hypothetical protein [Polycladidibacter hongkongensis]|uniref:hypothetical protein n=1 Tax=Polycladidibacter hongkongensis TaxID=1647556 RepID=UPI000835CD54|nr:hypothetical protein [Pseudovibrio hongkongensis]
MTELQITPLRENDYERYCRGLALLSEVHAPGFVGRAEAEVSKEDLAHLMRLSRQLSRLATRAEVSAALRKLYSNFASNNPRLAAENIRSLQDLLIADDIWLGALKETVMQSLRELEFMPPVAKVYKIATKCQRRCVAERDLLQAIARQRALTTHPLR